MPKKARRRMRVDREGWPVDAEQLASQLRFNPEFAQKVVDEIKPGTTVVITDQPVVRKPKSDPTFFAVKLKPAACVCFCRCWATRLSTLHR